MKLFFTTYLAVCFVGLVSAQNSNCDTWVKLQNRFAAITVGDLDITGDQITVEASFNMTGLSVDIVSKHKGGSDLNYLLRPVRAEVSTNLSGFVTTGQGASPCNDVLDFNKTYHAALVYNGSTLKFYRNGALISSVPCYGNLITNNWNTAIGEHAPVVTPFVNGVPNAEYHDQNTSQGYYDESFRGYINEVRIWNIARTQEELKTYMNTSLPNPASQTGLKGYWIFNDLHNLQGNATYDGQIEGLATIGQINTNCDFVADSCNVLLPLKLTSFDATVVGNKSVKLNWQAEEEYGITGYSIQRSESSGFNHYVDLGKVDAYVTGGTKKYSFSDNSIVNEKLYYYRLKINEINGSYTYSSIKSAKINGQPAFANIYPNPVLDGMVQVKFNGIQEGIISLQVVNCFGQLIINNPIKALPGNIVNLDLKKYPSGTYYIKLISSKSEVSRKIIKE